MYFTLAGKSLRVIERERNVTLAVLLTRRSAWRGAQAWQAGPPGAKQALGPCNLAQADEAADVNLLRFSN